MAKITVLDRELYGVAQAADLLGLEPVKVRRWLDGYDRKGVHYDPVVRLETTGRDTVTWGEFVELGYLREYRKRKVSLQRLRNVVDHLRDEMGVPYPLAHYRPYTAGRDLVMRVQEETKLPQDLWMVVPRNGQLELAPMANEFYKKVEFVEDIAGLLRVDGEDSDVVIDPRRGFGMPTIRDRGIRTEVLYELFRAGDTMDDIAEGYELTPRRVEDALRFESKRRRAA